LNLLEFLSLAGIWLFASVACLSIAAQNVLFVGLGAWLLLSWRRRRWPELSSPYGSWSLFVLWALLASLASPDQNHSLFTWKKWLLAYCALYVGQAIPSRRVLQAVLGSLLVFSALWCLGASVHSLAKPLAWWHEGHSWTEVAGRWVYEMDWRAGSGSGGYQVLASCCTLLLLFFGGLMLGDPWWRRPLVWVCLASIALALLLTMTRGAWIATALGLVFLLAWRQPKLLLGLAVLSALAFSLFSQSFVIQRLKSVTDLHNDSNDERIFMAQAGWSIIGEHPILGVGDSMHSFERDGLMVPGNFLTHRSPEAVAWYNAHDPNKEQGHLHDDLVQVAAMYGLPGLFLLLFFFLRLALAALNASRQAGPATALAQGFLAALLGWWANGAFEYNFGSFQSSFVLWFLVGLFLASQRLPDMKDAKT
jgi:O-antigen ligase